MSVTLNPLKLLIFSFIISRSCRYRSLMHLRIQGKADMAETMRKLVAEKHLRRRAVEEITGLSRSTITT